MKHLAYLPIAAVLRSLSYASLSADSPERPAGVAAENWVAVSDRLGIVLLDSGGSAASPMPLADGRRPGNLPVEPGGPSIAMPRGQALLLKPPVGGYFMVKGASGWTRLVVVEPIKGPGDVG